MFARDASHVLHYWQHLTDCCIRPDRDPIGLWWTDAIALIIDRHRPHTSGQASNRLYHWVYELKMHGLVTRRSFAGKHAVQAQLPVVLADLTIRMDEATRMNVLFIFLHSVVGV